MFSPAMFGCSLFIFCHFAINLSCAQHEAFMFCSVPSQLITTSRVMLSLNFGAFPLTRLPIIRRLISFQKLRNKTDFRICKASMSLASSDTTQLLLSCLFFPFCLIRARRGISYLPPSLFTFPSRCAA